MDDTGMQILGIFVAGLIFLIVWASRAWMKQIDRQLNRLGESGRAAQPPSNGRNRMTVISGPPKNKIAKQSPFDKYMAECVRTDCPPSTEYFNLQEKWQRQGWKVPTFMEAFDIYQNYRNGIETETEASKVELNSPPDETAPIMIPHNGKPIAPKSEPKAANPANQTIDMRQNTLDAMQKLPKTLPPTPQTTIGTIPLLYDGQEWHYMRLGQDGHWGFFGTSGSGKGNALQQVVNHVLACGPDKVELYVLDPKGGLDYIFCEDLAHAKLYYGPRLTDGCVDVVNEMNRRLDLLREARARNLPEYEEITRRKLPWLVVVVDEIAELDEAQRSFIETFARMSRAAGGVLLVATQYPTADVVSSQIQANVTNRVVFRLVSSDYVWVALRRRKNDPGQYDPSSISKNLPGVAVWRSDGGNEILGRSPEITDKVRQDWIRYLMQCWPKPTVSRSVSTETFPVRILNFERGNARNTSETPPETLLETPSETAGNGADEEEYIAALLRGGMSKRRILDNLKGNRQKRLEQINQIENKLGLKGDAV